MREAQDPRGEADRLSRSGDNLCRVLQRLQGRPEIWKSFLEHLQDVYPNVRALRVSTEAGKLSLYADEAHGSTHAARLSDGTLKYICLLAALLDPHQPTLLAIDEPDNGLHPDAISGMARLLEEAAQRFPVVVTTHSFMLVDCVADPLSIVVCERPEDGTTLRRLTSADLSRWREVYEEATVGELWTRGHIGGTRW